MFAKLAKTVGNGRTPKRARTAAIAVLDQGVTSAANFLTGAIIGRHCPPEQLGLYLLGFTLCFLLKGIQRPLITGPFTVFLPRTANGERRQYYGSALLLQLGFATAAFALLASGTLLAWLGVGPDGLPAVLLALTVLIHCILLRDAVRFFCFARFRFATALVFDICVAVLQVGGVVTLAHRGWLSAAGAHWAIGLASAAASLLWLMAM